mmetsp:Transcript_57809/g.126677  ORF Transcript_57809/g.126677 Transcript_57809/m.126677 type:complete len:221 (+) Transcript_57809:622-1284(+)
MIKLPFFTCSMMPLSKVNFSTCLFTLVVTASRSWALLSRTAFRSLSFKPSLRPVRRLPRQVGSLAMSAVGSWAALIAPQPSWPMTIRTLTERWWTAYSKEAVVVLSKQFPATRTTNMSPRPWSKTISTGTRESEHPKTAVNGNCFEINALRSKALASGRWAAPIQNRAFPFWRADRTSSGFIRLAIICSVSAFSRASSMVKPVAMPEFASCSTELAKCLR